MVTLDSHNTCQNRLYCINFVLQVSTSLKRNTRLCPKRPEIKTFLTMGGSCTFIHFVVIIVVQPEPRCRETTPPPTKGLNPQKPEVAQVLAMSEHRLGLSIIHLLTLKPSLHNLCLQQSILLPEHLHDRQIRHLTLVQTSRHLIHETTSRAASTARYNALT